MIYHKAINIYDENVKATDELPNVRVYDSRNAILLVRLSKSLCYERPCSVIGTIKLIGLEEASKDICRARIIGTLKADNMEETQFQ